MADNVVHLRPFDSEMYALWKSYDQAILDAQLPMDDFNLGKLLSLRWLKFLILGHW